MSEGNTGLTPIRKRKLILISYISFTAFFANSKKDIHGINGLTDQMFYISINITKTGVLVSNVLLMLHGYIINWGWSLPGMQSRTV